MKIYRFELGLAAAVLAIFVGALAFWGDWAGGRMTRQEVDDYLAAIEKNLEWPEPTKSYMMQSLREWGYADDGKEIMMLNPRKPIRVITYATGIREKKIRTITVMPIMPTVVASIRPSAF